VAAPYRGGPSKVWLKAKNPQSEAARPEREEDCHERTPAFKFRPHGEQEEGDHNHADNDSRERGRFDDGKPS
jgi:hypothetical protein